MNKIITRLAGTAGAVALGVAAMGAMAPDASAYSRGSATTSEARKVLRGAEDQRCLTLKEARKMVKANGTYSGTDEIGARYYHFAGKGNVRTLDISVLDGCTDLVVIDWRRGATTAWGNYRAWQAYAA